MVIDGKVANGFANERSYFLESSIHFSSGLLVAKVSALEGNVRVKGLTEINSVIINFLKEIPDSFELMEDEGVDGVLAECCEDFG